MILIDIKPVTTWNKIFEFRDEMFSLSENFLLMRIGIVAMTLQNLGKRMFCHAEIFC